MHRIIDANGIDHVVLIVGEGKRDNSGAVATVDGYVTDLTIDLMPRIADEFVPRLCHA